jgi:osmotically-inducible protein OsmY
MVGGLAVILMIGMIGISPLEATAGTRSDTWITMKTKIALATADDVDAMDINVDTVRGRVTLHGKVSSQQERAKAEKVTRKVDGVHRVHNLLQVIKSEGERERVEESDENLEERIEEVFDRDPLLAGSGVSVSSVNNGVVLLGGQAKTLSEHLEAVEAARSVPGVRKVASQVKSPDVIADDEIWREAVPADAGAGIEAKETETIQTTVSDLRITTAVKMHLVAAPDVPAMDVNVDTHDGVVTLFGIVANEESKAAAESEAREVNGVVEVRNALQVVPKARRDIVEERDEDVEREVKKELKGERQLKSAKIDVEVKNGVVRLTGTADSQSDRLAAAFVARSVRGVRSVQNDLMVEDDDSAGNE